MRPVDLTTLISGCRYFSVAHFAWVTHRSVPNIRFLMSYGNRIRKLKVRRFDGKPYIPYSELTEFPFTMSGRNSTEVYHYSEEGHQVTEVLTCKK
jgi:hypothetical protein